MTFGHAFSRGEEPRGPVSEAAGTRTRDQRIKSPLLYRLSYSLEDLIL